MEAGILGWLDSVGATAFRWSAVAFLLINGVAIAAVMVTRDRTLVNRWTGRLLAVNLGLAFTGLGVPLLTTVTRLAVTVIMPATRIELPVRDGRQEAARENAVELQRR